MNIRGRHDKGSGKAFSFAWPGHARVSVPAPANRTRLGPTPFGSWPLLSFVPACSACCPFARRARALMLSMDSKDGLKKIN